MAGGDFGGRTIAVEGLHLHQLGQRIELDDAALDVAVEQQRKDFARGFAVLREQVLGFALGGFSALAAREQRCIPRQMAKQVEGIGVGLFAGGRQFLEANAALGQLAQHFAARVRISPFGLQRLARGIQRAKRPARIFGVLDDLELLAVGVEVIDQMADDLDFAAVDVIFAGFGWRFAEQMTGAGANLFLWQRVLRFFLRFQLGGGCADLRARFIDRHHLDARGVAVEIRVSEVLRGRAGEVDNVEVFLAVVHLEPGAAADDLLELGARADHAGQHHVLDHLGIDAGGQQLRGGEDDGRGLVHVLKIGEVREADVAFVGGDAADVVRILLDQIAVEVDEFLPHLGGVFLIDAEHQRLRSCLEIPAMA
jgi:hypothetical protein